MSKEAKQLLERIDRLSARKDLDLSLDEDLSIAVMNLISLEEHFFFTGSKTNKSKYYDCLDKVRQIRRELMKKLIGKTEGEVWCISKHLLATSMRLIEVGTKYQDEGKKTEAEDFFNKAWSLYSLFWGTRLGAIETGELKKVSKENLPEKLEELIKKLVDCCQ